MSTSSTSSKKTETGFVHPNQSTKSVASVRSASRTTTQNETTSSRPVRPTRSLREKVLTRSTSVRSSISEDVLKQSLLLQPISPTEIAHEKVASWDREEIPPRPVESDDDLSEGSISEHVGRPSMIYYTTRGTGIEMDVATKTANEMLQKAKEALEAAGNMKRECKHTAIECLQTLYETVLSLSDSRSRHKYNLEKERHRHAQEIVRIERAHSKILAETLNDINTKLTKTQTDITGNLEETQAIRSWLGYETQEPYKKIDYISNKVADLEKSIAEVAKLRSGTKNTGDIESLISTQNTVTTKIDKLSNQLDDLRRNLDKVKEGTKTLINTNTKILAQSECQDAAGTQRNNEETVSNGLAEVKVAITQAEKNICQTIAAQPTPQVAQVTIPNDGFAQHLQPITERLEAVSSELRTIRETRSKTPPPITSIGTEIALADLVQKSKPTYAQIAQKPRAPQPNHTLIVSSTDPQKTGENVIDNIRAALDLKNTGAKIDRVRKGRNKKVILSCSTKEDLNLIKTKINHDNSLKTEIPKINNPLAKIKDVLAYHSDSEVVKYILSQNTHLLEGIKEQDRAVRVRYRKKARNPLECHLVLELSPEVHKRFIDAGKIYIDLQRRPIEDQSPLVQCNKCLGFGHTKTTCRETDQLCSYCGENHIWDECSRRAEGQPPACKNCQRAKNKTTDQDHIAFSAECPEKQKWDFIARSRITYC